MIIKFKNKMTMSLNKMIEEGKRLGGVPSHIEISPNEAVDVFNEIRSLTPSGLTSGYSITDKDGTSCKLLLHGKDLTQADLQGFAFKWRDGDWKVEFHKIPVIVVTPSPQTVHLHG